MNQYYEKLEGITIHDKATGYLKKLGEKLIQRVK
jgi:hypothetical protein